MSNTTLNKYSSIVPSEMSNQELRAMCAELHVASAWGKRHARVYLTSSNMEYDVEVSRLSDYQQQYQTETGAIVH